MRIVNPFPGGVPVPFLCIATGFSPRYDLTHVVDGLYPRTRKMQLTWREL